MTTPAPTLSTNPRNAVGSLSQINAPNPKEQALAAALELARIRGSAGMGSDRMTSVNQLLTDSRAISAYLGSA